MARMAERASYVAEQRAIRDRNLAQEAKEQADQQKNIADKLALEKTEFAKQASLAAAVAESQYFISKADLPNAWDRLQQADELGIKFHQRRIYDEFRQLSRAEWQLTDFVETKTIHAEFGESGVLAYVEGKCLNLRYGPGQVKTLNLPDFTTELLRHGRSQLISRTQNGIVVVECDPELKVAASRNFDSEIVRIASSPASILVALASGRLCLIEGSTLKDIETWQWADLPCEFGLTNKTKVCLSPDDNYILLHGAPWTNAAVILDRTQKPSAARKLPRGEVRLGATGQVLFDPRNSLVCYGWFSPSATGGISDQVWRLSVDQNKARTFDLTNNNRIKDQQAIRLDSNGLLSLIGSAGVGTVSVASKGNQRSVRYDTLWPFDKSSPKWLAADADGKHLAIKTSEGIAVFTAGAGRPISIASENRSVCGGAGGVLSLTRDARLTFEPYDFSKPTFHTRPQWISTSKSRWIPWGCDIAHDGRTAVVLAQESDGSDTRLLTVPGQASADVRH